MPQAQAMAVRGDRIVALGSGAEIQRYVGPTTQVIDLQGQLVIPGFIESHGHFTGVGEAQLKSEPDRDDELGRRSSRLVADAAKTRQAGRVDPRTRLAPGEMDGAARARTSKGFPRTRRWTPCRRTTPCCSRTPAVTPSSSTPRRWQVSGITRATPSPPRRRNPQGRGGEPTGLLRETAERSRPHRTRATPGATRKALELASAEALSKGITTFSGRRIVVRHHRPDEEA